MGSLLGPSWIGGNKIRTLNNGDEIFPEMLAAIRNALQSINFETYVYEHGKIPEAFAQALSERAAAGVRVNVLVDGHGGKRGKRYRSMMEDAGVKLHVYHPWFDIRRYNYRTHRKLLIVDGRIGFIGGVGIGDDWKGRARSAEEWRETHYRVEGPVVAQLQAAFADNWLESEEEVLQGPGFFPALPPVGKIYAAAFVSSPRSHRSHVELMYHLAIASARHSLLIATPYFVPDDTLLDALCAASRRGVKVAILMPGEHIDSKSVRRASRKRWRRLRECGVQLFEYEPTMMHTKLLVADGLFVSVGSGNFDPRSLRINDEANLNVLDAGFAREQTRIFEADLRRARPVERTGGPAPAAEIPLQAIQTPVEGQL
ncbi:MAG: phospholipase D-like domain-containing protein [Verrucomicrobiales bacterium]